MPTVKSSGSPSTSIRTRSNTVSRSSDSPGTCWKYHAIAPVRGSSASVELEYSTASDVVRPRLTAAHGLACAVPMKNRPRSGSYVPGIQVSAPPRTPRGRSPHVSPPGSPGCAIVDVRHSSAPVSGSCPVMKHPAWVKRPHPVMPLMTTPSATVGPAVW